MENKGTNLFAVFIIIVLGAVLLGVLANTIKDTVDPLPVTNEALNISNISAGDLGGTTNLSNFAQDEVQSGSLTCVNGTSNTGIDLANFTIDYDVGTIAYNTDNSGITSTIQYSNRSLVNCTYEFTTDNYIGDSTSRTIARQYTLFFVLAILLFVIGLAWMTYKNQFGEF